MVPTPFPTPCTRVLNEVMTESNMDSHSFCNKSITTCQRGAMPKGRGALRRVETRGRTTFSTQHHKKGENDEKQ